MSEYVWRVVYMYKFWAQEMWNLTILKHLSQKILGVWRLFLASPHCQVFSLNPSPSDILLHGPFAVTRQHIHRHLPTVQNLHATLLSNLKKNRERVEKSRLNMREFPPVLFKRCKSFFFVIFILLRFSLFCCCCCFLMDDCQISTAEKWKNYRRTKHAKYTPLIFSIHRLRICYVYMP